MPPSHLDTQCFFIFVGHRFVLCWNVGDINSLYVACQTSAQRCLSEGHIAGGVSQDTFPMIMFMKIITGLWSCWVPSLENLESMNFKLYCSHWKTLGHIVQNICTITEVSLCLSCKNRCSLNDTCFKGADFNVHLNLCQTHICCLFFYIAIDFHKT